MKEKDLKKIKWLVILLKLVLIGSFIVILFLFYGGMKNSFLDGLNGRAERSGIGRHHFSLGYDLVEVEPSKDSIFYSDKDIKVIGAHSFIVQKKDDMGIESSGSNGSFWLGILNLTVVIIALVYFVKFLIAFFKLLNRLQRLQIFDKENISIFRKLIKAMIIANIGITVNDNVMIYKLASRVHIPHYRTVLFSWENLDLNFILTGIVLYLVMLIWDHAIDLKSENDLTV